MSGLFDLHGRLAVVTGAAGASAAPWQKPSPPPVRTSSV